MNEEERVEQLHQEILQEINAFVEKECDENDDEDFRDDLRWCLWQGAMMASKLICDKTQWIEDDDADWWKE